MNASLPIPGQWSARAAALFSGYAFDLGDRQLDLLITPGHSPDSVMLLDRQNGVLFTGDTVYPAALYAHLDSVEYGKSSLRAYAETMHALRELRPHLDCLCCSHNVPVNSPRLLSDVTEAFEGIRSGRSRGMPAEDGTVYHAFEGFAIITKMRCVHKP